MRKVSARDDGSNPESDCDEGVDKMTISEWQGDGKVTEWHGEQSYVQIKGHLSEDIVVGIQSSKEDGETVVHQEETDTPSKTLYTISESSGNKTAAGTVSAQLKKLENMADKMMRIADQFRNTVEDLKSQWAQEKESVRSHSRVKERNILNSHMETHVTYDSRDDMLPVTVVNTVETVGLQPTTDINENKKVRKVCS